MKTNQGVFWCYVMLCKVKHAVNNVDWQNGSSLVVMLHAVGVWVKGLEWSCVNQKARGFISGNTQTPHYLWGIIWHVYLVKKKTLKTMWNKTCCVDKWVNMTCKTKDFKWLIITFTLNIFIKINAFLIDDSTTLIDPKEGFSVLSNINWHYTTILKWYDYRMPTVWLVIGFLTWKIHIFLFCSCLATVFLH